MRTPCCIVFSILIFCLILPKMQAVAQEAPLTRAETSGYAATSRYVDVMGFILDLQRKSLRVRLEVLGTSAEGREIPLLVIGDPVPASPDDLVRDERMVVYPDNRRNQVGPEKGTLFVPMAQPLANVAAYLLEPESDDGLMVWIYFDSHLAPRWGRAQQADHFSSPHRHKVGFRAYSWRRDFTGSDRADFRQW